MAKAWRKIAARTSTFGAEETWREGEVISAIPQGVTHLEVTDNGANFWSITEPADGTGEVWLGGKWMASEISDRLMQRLISFTPLAIALAGYTGKEVSVES